MNGDSIFIVHTIERRSRRDNPTPRHIDNVSHPGEAAGIVDSLRQTLFAAAFDDALDIVLPRREP